MMRTLPTPFAFLLGLTLGSLTLGGCAFTYIPVVREAQAPEPRLTLSEQSALRQEGDTLSLELLLKTVPKADWLVVQWFDPANDEVYATSLWLEPRPDEQTLSTPLPAEIALEDGLWRTIVSYQGRLERQFSLSVRVP
jgi:hypothetical protein